MQETSTLGGASGSVNGSAVNSGSFDGFSALASERKQQSRFGKGLGPQDGQQHNLLGIDGFDPQQQSSTALGHLPGSAQQEVLVGGGLTHLQRSLSLLD
jgi:hypothetical protein